MIVTRRVNRCEYSLVHVPISDCTNFLYLNFLYLFRFNIDSSLYEGNDLRDQVMRMWIKRRHLLIHDYSLVGYLLSPNPTIMAHAIANREYAHEAAAERLIVKLILNPTLVGSEREVEKARLIDKFHRELNDFQGRRGRFDRTHIWISAADPDQQAHRWHQNYSLTSTEVLGRLACLVTSKILGIGTAERNWKQVKAVKTGQRATTGIEKAKQQVMIYAQYQQMRAQARITKLSSAGKLWDDADFKCCKMDAFCGEIEAGLEMDNDTRDGDIRIFKAWQETWEKKKVGPGGDAVFRARLLRKYGGLKWFDQDSTPQRVFTAYPTKMQFEKVRGNNHYTVFGTLEGYDDSKLDNDPANIEFWEPWEFFDDFYDAVCLYYEGSNEVKCYKKDESGCNSDEE